jgi:diguanylate cyclase (GGDEF)-like protein
MDATPSNHTAPHWIVQLNRVNRIASYLMLFAILGAHMRTQTPPYGPYAWALLVLQFMVYPHVAYWRACRARDTRLAELHNLTIDSLLFGIWTAALGFPVWITFTLYITTTINHALYRDPWAMTHSAAAIAVGVLLAVAFGGLHFSLATDWPTTALCIIGLTLYLVIVANVAYTRNHQLHRVRKQLQLDEQALQKQLDEINMLQKQLSEQANRDALTGLYNRRYLDSTLERELARCQREGLPLSLMLIDLDHFKQINDTYGHQAGDEVLKQLADTLNTQARSADIVCRFGGEEFLLLLPNMPLAVARERAEQWRSGFAATTIAFGEFRIHGTLSIGLSSYPGHGTSPQALIRSADRALYRAKSEGRNRVVVADVSTPVPDPET